MYRILCVCTGNICRSPTAEAVLKHYAVQHGLIEKIHIESAGTHGYHIGEPPDPRAIATAHKRGISLEGQRARKIDKKDFSTFDLILAMDRSHYQALQSHVLPGRKDSLALFLSYAGEINGSDEVPDPYYGEVGDFEHVLDLAERAAPLILEKIKAILGQKDN